MKMRNVTLLFFKDYLARYGWSVPIVLLLSSLSFVVFDGEMFGALVGILIHVIAGIFLFAKDREDGVVRIYRTMPINSHTTLTRLFWLEGTLLYPILFAILFLVFCLVRLPLSLVFGSSYITSIPEMVDVVIVVFTMSAFNSSIWIYVVPKQISSKHRFGCMIQLLLIFIQFCFILFNVIYIFELELGKIWTYFFIPVFPIAILTSFYFHDRLIPRPKIQQKDEEWVEPIYYVGTPLSYWSWCLRDRIFRMLLIWIGCAVFAITCEILLRLLSDKSRVESQHILFAICVFILLVSVPVLPISLTKEIRQLRILPLSSIHLTCILLIDPIICILSITTPLVILFCITQSFNLLYASLSCAFISLSFSVLACNFSLIFQLGKNNDDASFPIIFVALICGGLSYYVTGSYLGVFAFAAISIATIPLITYQIKNSSRICRRRIAKGE